MHILFSVIIILTSLTYLNIIADGPKSYQDFSYGAMAMLVYGVINFLRSMNIMLDEDDDRRPIYDTYDDYYYSGWSSTPRRERRYHKSTEQVTTYSPMKRERAITERTIKTYPSKKEVNAKIAELETNPLWCAKRSVCGFFGHDITKKLYEPTVTIEQVPVERNSFRSYLNKEYNDVVKNVGRSFEIALTDDNITEAEEIVEVNE